MIGHAGMPSYHKTNAGKPAVLCHKRYARLLVEAYSDESQCEMLHECNTSEQTQQMAMQHIFGNAHEVKSQFWFGKRFAAPSSFISVQVERSMEN